MGASYEIWAKTSSGVPLAIIDNYVSFEYYRSAGVPGTFNLQIPWGAYPSSYFADDTIFELWRCVDGGLPYLEGGTQFFQHYRGKALDTSGLKTLSLVNLDPLEIFDHRIVAYNANTSQTSKSGACDDMMKDYVSENSGSGTAYAARMLYPSLTVQNKIGTGPSSSKTAAWRNTLLAVLQEIAADSFTKGIYMTFDVVSLVPSTGIALEFRTYTGCRGIDRRYPNGVAPLLLTPENGNLVECQYIEDNRSMYNAVYAGGQGQDDARIITQSIDQSTVQDSFWNRHEYFLDARNVPYTAGSAAVQAEGDAFLWANRTRKTFTSRFVDTEGIQYGRDFHYGDYLTAVWDDESWDMRVGSVGIQVKDGVENVSIIMRSDA